MNLVARVKGILLQPQSEWQVIDREPGDAGYLFKNYVMIVGAIPPVCAFIGAALLGFGMVGAGFAGIMIHLVIGYLLTLLGVFILAYVIDFLAGTFGGRRDISSAMKVSAYAPTAIWIVGVFNIIPGLGILKILGLYSLYLLHTGIAALMKPPSEKVLVYTIAVVGCVIVFWIVVLGIPAMMFGMPRMMM